MSQYGSWSVKGVDDRARAIAKEKARLKGITLGDYINNLLMEGHSEAGPRDLPYQSQPDAFAPPRRDVASAPDQRAIDALAQRIEAVEARSTLAITGIDQSVLGMLSRLEGTENSSAAMAAEVEAMVDELRETHESLAEKVSAMESDESGAKSLAAMKALEGALGKLASHVYEESRLTQDETAAVKGRVEAGFSEVNERVEGIEVKVESTLAEAAKRVEKAVEQAELRAEGKTRELSERFATLESSVASKLSKVDEVDARMTAVEGDVSGAITSLESTVLRIQERLGRAEMTTDTALKALEQTFASLDERIDRVAQHADPEKAEALRREFETRFDSLAASLRASVEQSRQQLADEIEQAAARANPELMGELTSRIDSLEKATPQQMNALVSRVDSLEQANPEQIGELNSRVAMLEQTNPAVMIESLGEQVSQMSDTLDQRINDSERRSAAAIEQVGEHMAGAIRQVHARQDKNHKALEEKIEAQSAAQANRLSEALSNVSSRFAEMKAQTAASVSPVQRAILSIAERLEALEDFTAPPLAEPQVNELPDMPEIDMDDAPVDLAHVPDPVAPTEAASESDDFIAGLPDFEADSEDVLEASDDEDNPLIPEPEDDPTWTQADADEDYPTEPVAAEPAALDDDTFDPLEDELREAVEDPLAELGSWEDAQQEARDSDIFADEAEDDPMSTFDPDAEDEQLAHNLDLEDDLLDSDEVFDDETAVADADETAGDYLSRARAAAVAASGKDATSARKARAVSAKPSSKGGKKVPVIAAASAFAIAAAGAGGWVALRGKINLPGGDKAAITSSATATGAALTANEVSEPSLSGVEFAEADASMDETLFEEEGSVFGQPELAAPSIAAPVLPEIPSAVSLEQAALSGDPVAEFKFGEAQLDANDFATGAEFVRRAANQGLPAAQYRLAKLHERGVGVARDLTEARTWTERAANGGNTKAMHDLAVFYADGEGGAQSYAAAAEWFRKAADYGVVDSQYNLAVLYENGLGISPSQGEALYWYEVASLNGDASAPGNVAQLSDALPSDIAEHALGRAASWSAAPANGAANGRFGAQDWELSTQAQVAAVQTVLNGLGYDAGTPDGIVGSGTRTAIRAYQADNSLVPNGQIDDALIEALNDKTQGLAG